MNQAELTRALVGETEWLGRFSRVLVAGVDADDLAQETVLAGLRQQARPHGELRPWLKGVARRLHLGHRRSEARRTARERAVARPDATDASDTTAELVARAEVHRCVVNAVMALSEPARTTILLRFWEGLPPREVAARMAVPVETVRTRTKRALARLRRELDASAGDRRAWLAPLATIAGVPQPDVAALPTAPTVPYSSAIPARVFGVLGVVGVGMVVALVVFAFDGWGGGDAGRPQPAADRVGAAIAAPAEEPDRLRERLSVDEPVPSEPTAGAAVDPGSVLARIDACWEIEDYWQVIDELGAGPAGLADSLLAALRIAVSEPVAPALPGRRVLDESQTRDARFEVLLQALARILGPAEAGARVAAMPDVRLPQHVRHWATEQTVPPPPPPPPPPGDWAAAFEAKLLDPAQRDQALIQVFGTEPTDRLVSLVTRLPPSPSVRRPSYGTPPGRVVAWVGALATSIDGAPSGGSWADALASRIAARVSMRFRGRPRAEELRRIDLGREIDALRGALTERHASPAVVPILTAALLHAQSVSGVPRSQFDATLEQPSLAASFQHLPADRETRAALAQVQEALLWLQDVRPSEELLAFWRGQSNSRASTGYFMTVLTRCAALRPEVQAGLAAAYGELARQHADARVRLLALGLYLRWESDESALAAALAEVRSKGDDDALGLVVEQLPMRWHRGAGDFEAALDWLDWALEDGTDRQVESILDGLEDGYDNAVGELAGDLAARVVARMPAVDDPRLSERARRNLVKLIDDLDERVTKARNEDR